MGSGSDYIPGQLEQLKADSFNRSEGGLDREDGYSCKVCNNKGMLLKPVCVNGYWSLTATECKCMEVRRSIRRMQESGLKNIIKDYTFKAFRCTEDWQRKIKEAAVNYSRNPEGWFFIGGQSGSGKTHICTAICREFLLSGKQVRYMLWRDDITRIKGLLADPEQYRKVMEDFKNAEVLYIDDLFKSGKVDGQAQKPTAADVNAAFEILNYRYNSNLLTVISSECTVNDLLDIDEAVGGRIFERAKNAFSLKPDRKRNYRLKGCVEL